MIYALNQNDMLVHVDSVPNGLKCNCHCPSCGESLSARQGKKKQHSFAHSAQNESKCAYGYQTSLHLLAKEIFNEGCEILLPPVYYDEEEFDYSKFDSKTYNEIHNPLFNAYRFQADSVELEKQYDNFIPDIILYYKGKPLVVEICVTHPVDDEKKEKIKMSKVSAVEFDLSKVDREIDKDCLRGIFESGENCRWIYNSKGSDQARDFMKIVEERFEKKKQEEQRKKEEEEKRKKELVKQYGGNFQYYKTYFASLDLGPVSVIYDPPCKNAVEYRGSRCKPVEYCYRCPYFIKYEPEQEGLNPEPLKRLFCQRQRFDNPNPKPNISTGNDIKKWIDEFYEKHSNKVSRDQSKDEDLIATLVSHAEEVARLSGHEELLGIIPPYCKSLVTQKHYALINSIRLKPRRIRF